MTELKVSNTSNPNIQTVTWSQPVEPNGEVIAYTLSIQPEDDEKWKYEVSEFILESSTVSAKIMYHIVYKFLYIV